MWSRFFPSVNKASEWIKSGRIGKIQSVTATIGFNAGGDTKSRLLSKALGGGALYDIGVYVIELVTYLVGEKVIDVVGSCRKNPVTGVDENDTFILSFDGFDAALSCTLTAKIKEHIIICGDKGIVEIPVAHINDSCLLYNERNELVEGFKEEFPNGNGFVYQIEEVTRCINGKKTESSVMPHSATIECCEIFDKLLS